MVVTLEVVVPGDVVVVVDEEATGPSVVELGATVDVDEVDPGREAVAEVDVVDPVAD